MRWSLCGASLHACSAWNVQRTKNKTLKRKKVSSCLPWLINIMTCHWKHKLFNSFLVWPDKFHRRSSRLWSLSFDCVCWCMLMGTLYIYNTWMYTGDVAMKSVAVADTVVTLCYHRSDHRVLLKVLPWLPLIYKGTEPMLLHVRAWSCICITADDVVYGFLEHHFCQVGKST